MFPVPLKFRKLIQPEARALENPSSSGIGTARAAAKVYGILANGGQTVEGQRLLSAEMVERIFTEARSPSADKVVGFKSTFSSGYFLSDFEVGRFFGSSATIAHCVFVFLKTCHLPVCVFVPV